MPVIYDNYEIHIDGKGLYENCINAHSQKEEEFLNGVALREGHYCIYYKKARDLNSHELDSNGMPYLQHYCSKNKVFMGFAYCCSPHCNNFSKGKSAGIKRKRNKIIKHRKEKGFIIYDK